MLSGVHADTEPLAGEPEIAEGEHRGSGFCLPFGQHSRTLTAERPPPQPLQPFVVSENRMRKQAPCNKNGPVRGLMLLVFVLVAQDCWACRKAPEEQLIGADEQIMRATDVSVARVVSATPVAGGQVEYRFVVLERLAGANENMFTVPGRDGTGAGNDTFDNHASPAFWERGGGRVMNGGDCMIHPRFLVGGTYLVFLGSPWTWRSFEQIAAVDGLVDEREKWLVYVRARLAQRADTLQK